MMHRQVVEARADGRCEYCRAPQEIAGYTFHLEHILPRAKGGNDTDANAALSCWSCNSSKRAHLTGKDPRTGKQVPLFHPRRQSWNDHFRVSADGCRLLGRTPVGRATVEWLQMNAPRFQPKARKLWRQAGRWP